MTDATTRTSRLFFTGGTRCQPGVCEICRGELKPHTIVRDEEGREIRVEPGDEVVKPGSHPISKWPGPDGMWQGEPDWYAHRSCAERSELPVFVPAQAKGERVVQAMSPEQRDEYERAWGGR